ncbi:unnamed protein product [Oreochromis niloticus]|nr:unnamed protein product [Mustela putorius furo]
MDEFRWIQMFSCLMIQIAVSVTEASMFMKVGDDVTLPCLNVIDDQNNCDGTTWFFTSRNRETVELIILGQIGEEAKTKSDRLSVTANCSLLIKNVTVEDVGIYSCRQYRLGRTRAEDTLVHQSFIDLSVITLTEHEVTDKVTLSCSVVTYEQCHHTVKWLLKGRDVDKEYKEIVTSQTDCAATVSFLESHYIYPSRYNIMKCEVTDTNTRRVQLFTFSLQPSGEETGDTKTTTNPARKTEISTKSETNPTIKSPSKPEKADDRVPGAGLWCTKKSGVAEKYVRVVQEDMYEEKCTGRDRWVQSVDRIKMGICSEPILVCDDDDG